MKIAIGADHAGYEYKDAINAWLKSHGHDVMDMGTNGTESVDYPDFAELVAHSVSKGEAERGVLICGSGIGMSMTANKIRGIRAALVTDVYTAKMSRAHNDANVLCLGARVVPKEQITPILDAWFSELFEGGRHERRVVKMKQLDAGIAAFEE